MSATILLVRHGMCAHVGKRLAGRSPGVELDEEGVRQAERLASRLGGERLRAIYASPLERTVASALPAGRRLDLPVIPCEALIEIDYGQWTGRDLAQMGGEPGWESYNLFRSGTRIPDGDFFPAVQARVASELELPRKR
ncbi:MAG: histidine phosphatase family protein, partial [Deltaproteobacteria bacterium]|nr:histidine phosphatase family protein [Deltaproteobacteria bacterium]